MKRILAISLLAVLFIVWAVWFVFPEESLQSLIGSAFADSGITVELTGFKKGLFYNFSIGRLSLKTPGGELISFDSIRARVNPLRLFTLRLDTSFKGHAGGGYISGHMRLKRNGVKGRLDMEKAVLGELPILKRAGVRGTGTVSGKCVLADDNGHIDFITQDADFEPMKFSGINLPLNFFHTIRGSLDIKGDIIRIVSIALEGKDVYARLRGDVKNAFIDLKMELMPGASFAGNPLFLAEFEKYKVSPGYYVIAVKQRLFL